MRSTNESLFNNIETLRVIATILLVSYHAIGDSPEYGLHLDYPHPLRFVADIPLDVRMPVFAFISGWVYAIRPNTRGNTGAFFFGKVRRLIVPGVIVSLSFWVLVNYGIRNGVGRGDDFFDALVLDFVHFWYLQAIFIILLAMALIDGLAAVALPSSLLATIAVGSFFVPRIQVPHVIVDGILYLLPYFLFGRLFFRNRRPIWDRRGLALTISVSAIVLSIWLNIQTYFDTGTLSYDRVDIQSVLMGFGTITTLMLLLPRIPMLSAFGTASFTIYLFHVFGTSGMRRLSGAVGIENLWLMFVLTCVSGVVVPLIVHWVFSRSRITRVVFLGLRPTQRAARQTLREPSQP